MPLPPALIAKLQKRGIIKGSEQEDEVFVEHYDERGEDDDRSADDISHRRGGAPGCPNKWNPYHLCSEFCFDHWGDGIPENRLGDGYHHARRLTLLKYPLPEEWKEVYDAGVKRHYYWNQCTDEVTWLPPRHPNASIGLSAQELAKEFFETSRHKSSSDETDSRGSQRSNDRRRDDGRRRDRDSGRDEKAVSLRRNDDIVPTEMSDRERLKRTVKKKADPMDPASYSDCGEGSWSAGLIAEAKTGVDTTATGPLFQARPYKSPGDILRAQKKK